MLANGSNFIFRSVKPDDRNEMQALHEELFPIRYNDSFYNEMVQGIGMHGGQLYSIIAEDPTTGHIAGFVIAQMLKYPEQIEDSNIFSYPFPKFGCYILTLGVASTYRRHGLATILLSKCKNYASNHSQCGALYLHVIHYNAPAIELYAKNNFQNLRSIPEFYYFNGQSYTAYLFVFYVNNYCAPGNMNESQSIFSSIGDWATKGWEIVSESVTNMLFTSTSTIADATQWIYQQFSPEVMAVSVAQISHHWSPNTSAVLPGPELPIGVTSATTETHTAPPNVVSTTTTDINRTDESTSQV